MDLHLKDKVYIVTGGANGIGRAICEELASEGAITMIVDRSRKEALELVNYLMKLGAESFAFIGDLTESNTSKQAVEKAISEFGRIDGIVNNAGKNDGVGLHSGDPGIFRSSVLANLAHYYDMVHYALPYLKESKGSIVNISSKTALTGQGGTSAYVASKGGQLALTREWAVELAPFDIRVNAIIPAEVHTPMYDAWLDTFDDPVEKLEQITSKIPLAKRRTIPSEIAAMTVFLLSNRSSHTTGQWIFVDGGYVHLDRSIK